MDGARPVLVIGFSILRMLRLVSDELEEVEHDVASKE
jgi:hypothetical protein